MKLWMWIALGAGGLLVLHFMASSAQANQPRNPLVVGSGGTDWLRVSQPNWNFGLKL